jgi:hypothetical protein
MFCIENRMSCPAEQMRVDPMLDDRFRVFQISAQGSTSITLLQVRMYKLSSQPELMFSHPVTVFGSQDQIF